MKRSPSPLYQQSLWRLRAAETRSIAERVSDPNAKRIVLEIAQRCDRLVVLIALVHALTCAASPPAPSAKLS
jgi:hypothetical protein